MKEQIGTKITLEIRDDKFIYQTPHWDMSAEELLRDFKLLMVAATYSPTVLNDNDGYWEWHDNWTEKEE